MSKSIINKQVLMDGITVAKAGTSYSTARRFWDCDGSVAVIIASSAGSISVSQQCSIDNINWFDPIASAEAVGVVGTGITVTTGIYVAYTPVLADYIRFKVVEANVAETVVTLTLVYLAAI